MLAQSRNSDAHKTNAKTLQKAYSVKAIEAPPRPARKCPDLPKVKVKKKVEELHNKIGKVQNGLNLKSPQGQE